MALKKTFTFKGVSVQSGYHRIHSMSIFKRTEAQINDDESITQVEKSKLRFNLSSHATSADEAITDKNYIIDYNLNSSDNAYVQAYSYLKGLEEFDGAQDV